MSPQIGLVLGSGLGEVVESLEVKVTVPFSEVPHFPPVTVPGHQGRLLAGYWGRWPVLVFQGRFHYYEGYSLAQVTFPVRILAALGAKAIILTNAAGGLREDWRVGDLMLIRDHLNFMGDNPLRGLTDPRLGPRFPGLGEAYDPELRRRAKAAAERRGLPLREGVYAAVPGPSYETPAEARFLRAAGADAVGMSTVPEVIVARQVGLRVLAVSCLTNILFAFEAADHETVVRRARQGSLALAGLLEEFLRELEEL
ncbi:MAG: purine-nucleoside phosphorylase [Moorellales bacterium]